MTFCALVMSISLSYGKCVSPRVYFDLPGSPVIDLSVHPEGDFALFKNETGAVTIFNLRASVPVAMKTNLSAEAFPVTATWSHFVNFHEGKTELVPFDQESGSLKEERSTYPSKILMVTNPPGKSEKGTKLRVLTSDGKLRDDFLSKGKIVPGDSRKLCSNLASPVYPVALSPDGSLLLCSTQRTTLIYRLGSDSSCEFVHEFPYLVGKGSFQFGSSKNRSLVFEAQRTVIVSGIPRITTSVILFNQDAKKTQKVSLDEETATDPNFLSDGRVAYLDASKRIVLVDPSQLDGEGKILSTSKSCIQDKSSH